MSKYLVRAVVGGCVLAVGVAFAVAAQAAETGKVAAAEKKVEKPKHQFFSGAIDAIDAKANTVTIKHKDDTKTFQCADKCKFVTEDKKPGATLSDFKVGDKVLVSYAEEDGKLVCLKIGPQPTPPPPKAKGEGKAK